MRGARFFDGQRPINRGGLVLTFVKVLSYPEAHRKFSETIKKEAGKKRIMG
jgi:hypothetical protein